MQFIDLKTQQNLIRTEIDAGIARVLDHGQYVMGPEVRELEARLAKYVGSTHCIGVASGTDSLLIALMALGIGPGDEVITVPYTWISTAEVISLLGAKPVFVDIDEHTWNLDASKLEAAITPKTAAIMPVGIFGQPADMNAINRIAEAYGDLPVIEDAAQSFGATHHGRRSGGLSRVGSTSFFPSKPLGCYGEGGALFTDDPELALRMSQIRSHGQSEKHLHPIVGINGRLDSIQAAILLAKMQIFDDEIEKRQKVASEYGRGLEGASVILPSIAEANTSCYAQYTILSKDREEISNALRDAGIPSVSYYARPLHLQPVFASLGHREGDFPNTEGVAGQGLSLPMNPYLEGDEVGQVCAIIREVVGTEL